MSKDLIDHNLTRLEMLISLMTDCRSDSSKRHARQAKIRIEMIKAMVRAL